MDDTALVALLRTLSENREAKRKLLARLAEIEKESAAIRSQMVSLDAVIEPAELALMQMLSRQKTPAAPSRPTAGFGDYDRYSQPSPGAQRHRSGEVLSQTMSDGFVDESPGGYEETLLRYAGADAEAAIDSEVDRLRRSEQSGNVRFNDFRIPQATTIVLREARGPLHVSEIFRRLRDGGFEFRGQHQLISLAVSLSRSKRFRKVAPGTFELNPDFQAGQVA
jgi:hypothetical protein